MKPGKMLGGRFYSRLDSRLYWGLYIRFNSRLYWRLYSRLNNRLGRIK